MEQDRRLKYQYYHFLLSYQLQYRQMLLLLVLFVVFQAKALR